MSQIDETEPLLFTETKTYNINAIHLLLLTLITVIGLFFLLGLTLMFIITTSVIFGFISVTIWVCRGVKSNEELLFPEDFLVGENVVVSAENSRLDITVDTKSTSVLTQAQLQKSLSELYSGDSKQNESEYGKGRVTFAITDDVLVDNQVPCAILVPTRETRIPLFDTDSKGDQDFD